MTRYQASNEKFDGMFTTNFVRENTFWLSLLTLIQLVAQLSTIMLIHLCQRAIGRSLSKENAMSGINQNTVLMKYITTDVVPLRK
jgi:hypothetical protein